MGAELPVPLLSARGERLERYGRQLLEEACLAVSRDMDSYDYHIARLMQKVGTAIDENPGWGKDRGWLLNLIRAAATGFGGRREKVWLASFECTLNPVPRPD